uniref:Uncharacterized protein n=1 Tax=Gongylonema pulchrum TaxID=637853 RepID=A0A183DWP8_9BILA
LLVPKRDKPIRDVYPAKNEYDADDTSNAIDDQEEENEHPRLLVDASDKEQKRHYSYGGASALSPALMLAALRSSDELFQRNSLIRNHSFVRLHSSPQCSSFSTEPPQKKPKIPMQESVNGDAICLNDRENSEELKQDSEDFPISDETTTATTATTTATTTRSRIWEFISSFLGTLGNSK